MTTARLAGGPRFRRSRRSCRRPDEIEQVKAKVREHAWAARLLDRVKEKAEKDGVALDPALAHVPTGAKKYADAARGTLLREARDQIPQYEKPDVKSRPEWGRWTWWGDTAWAYDPAYCRRVLLRFPKKTTGTLHIPSALYPQSNGQAAVEFPVRSGDEVSVSFTTQEELPRDEVRRKEGP